MLGDKPYSASAIRAHLRQRKIKPPFRSPQTWSATGWRRGSAGARLAAFDPAACKQGNTVKRAFGKLRQHRAVASSFD